MLKPKIDLNTICACLGHERLDTTNVYAEIGLETKAQAMALCDAAEEGPGRPWKDDKGQISVRSEPYGNKAAMGILNPNCLS